MHKSDFLCCILGGRANKSVKNDGKQNGKGDWSMFFKLYIGGISGYNVK